MKIIIPLLITLVVGFFAFVVFILADHKEDIWDCVEFPEDDSNE